MGINGIETQPSYVEAVQYQTANIKKTDNKKEAEKTNEKPADSYVKSQTDTQDSTKKIYKKDAAVIDRLKQDALERKQQLIALVEKTIGKQCQTYNTFYELFSAIKDGKVAVDPAAVEQAKKDVADDGYWGVEQTSNRFVEFAKALTSGDPSKADEMITAIEKGFEQAKKAWGDELPEICQKTIDAAKEKMNQWKNSSMEV